MTGRSSVWARWDPHIHVPGTALNDGYGDDWEGFWKKLEEPDHPVVALGITDYWITDGYEEFLSRRGERAPSVELVFPNIEMRIAPATAKGHPLNLHLLVSPHADRHLHEVKSKLAILTMTVREGRVFPCSKEGLIRLGRLRLGEDVKESTALRDGVEQFKLSADVLFDWYENDAWLKENAILAISGGNDGLAGMRRDSGFREVHDRLVRRSHLIFSPTPSDRFYFSGEGDSAAEVRELFGGPKPCVHGCDAHRVEDVLKPTLDRSCWIKSAPSFDGLRQVIYEPTARVHIGSERPPEPDPDQVISGITVGSHGGWFKTDSVELGAGLTAIIGEKGSGKTALADLLAAAAGAWTGHDASFLEKALPELKSLEVEVRWQSGRTSEFRAAEDVADTNPEVRYLSQQFVERLCSGDALADELIAEIERVVFDHLPEDDRLNASNFDELRRKKTSGLRAERDTIRDTLSSLSERIEEIANGKAQLPHQTAALKLGQAELKREQSQLDVLVAKADKKLLEAASKVRAEFESLTREAARLKEQQASLDLIKTRVERAKREFEADYRQYSSELEAAGIPPTEWARFRKRFDGDVSATLKDTEARTKELLAKVEGPSPDEGATRDLARVKAELQDLENKLDLDKKRATKVDRLRKAIAQRKTKIESLRREIDRAAKAAKDELPKVQNTRYDEYLRYFDLLEREREILSGLYLPLEQELASRASGESDLSFDVQVRVDSDGWAQAGEELLDLRRSGRYTQRGALQAATGAELDPAWRELDQSRIRLGLDEIIEGVREGDGGVRGKLRTGFTARHVADWLFSVDHIELEYSIRYRGTPLRLLSPGTRGIVLLVLYLAIDLSDDRPLIVDQPEENLDNASVYEILVEYFREAKQRRQVIVVTHNPNLVVNTDAERVVLASAQRRSNGLPEIDYDTGALEEFPGGAGPIMRAAVCAVLEGGERAFRMRERRYDLKN